MINFLNLTAKEHTMPRTKHLPFRKNLLAIAVGAALAPGASWALA